MKDKKKIYKQTLELIDKQKLRAIFNQEVKYK